MMTWILAVLLVACIVLALALRRAYKQLDKLNALYDDEQHGLDPVLCEGSLDDIIRRVEQKKPITLDSIIEEYRG